MKEYILVKESIPVGKAIVAVAHASLIGHLSFSGSEQYDNWLNKSFKKVVCAVTDEEFELAKSLAEHKVVTESSLDDIEVALVFKPQDVMPKQFKLFKLYN